MALRAGTRTVIKTVTDRFDNLRGRLLQNSSLRRIYKLREINALAIQESAEEERHYLDTLMYASKHRLDMLRLQLEEAELDNIADRTIEATDMLETAQCEHNRIETMYETATRKRDHAQARVKEARDQYRAAVEELHQLNTSQEYLVQCTEYNELSKTVSDKRRDNELVNDFDSSVSMH